MKLWLLCAVVCGNGACAVLLAVEATPSAKTSPDTEAALMRAKLASAQKVVEGLMVQDFKLVGNGGRELETICDATRWHAEEDQVYAHYRSELRRLAEKLAKHAQKEDRDGSTYIYMHLITNCISCHDYCRDVLRIARETPNLRPVPSQDTLGDDSSTVIRR